VRTLTEAELGRVVQQFEVLTSEVVTSHGGRLVKTLGDEVLFSTHDVAAAAHIAVDLVEAVDRDAILPHVRVGLACGPVVSRFGDVFGTTVNRASRLTAVAEQGCVVVDDAAATALARDPAFRLEALPTQPLHGLGDVPSWALRRTGTLDAERAGDRPEWTDDDLMEERDD
jgi:adenylate cyclase